MDLLLTHGYFLEEDPKELQIMKPYAPLGILYLSSYLRARGFAVEIYDSTFGSREALFRILLNHIRSVMNRLVASRTSKAGTIYPAAMASITGRPKPSYKEG